MIYRDAELTDEQALETLAARDQEISDVTAERDSLQERLDALTQQTAKLSEELQNTKKLNFTLASQIPAKGGPEPDDFFKEVLKNGY